ncbi:MAG: hypothetical protein JJU11_18100, partial [Candidatus Sumerlaeia bacterium]|nr:hypothetical protein [Candidatus Sumerlaeia bacterium]
MIWSQQFRPSADSQAIIAYPGFTPSVGWMISPPIPMEAGVTYDISYFATYREFVDLYVGTSSVGAGGLDGETLVFDSTTGTSGPENALEQFTAPTTDSYYLGFRATFTDDDDIAEIDNIRVVETGLPIISVGPATGVEEDEIMFFTITAEPPPSGPIEIDFEIINITTSEEDFDFDQELQSTFTFPGDGVRTTYDFPILLWNDGLPELDETFLLRLSNPSDGYIYQGEALGTILRSDFVAIIEEDFEGSTDTTLAGWNQTEIAGILPIHAWGFQSYPGFSSVGFSPIPDLDGRYAVVSSWNQRSATGFHQRAGGILEGPPFSTVGQAAVYLNYTYDIWRRTSNNFVARTEVSNDGGETWVTVKDYSNTPKDDFWNRFLQEEQLNISDVAADYPDVRFRFIYDDLGFLNGHFLVDDVEVIIGELPFLEDRIVNVRTITPEVNEGESLIFEVYLNEPAEGDYDLLVDYTVGGEVNALDFADPMSGTLTFTEGETTKTVTLATINDDLVKNTRQIDIVLSNLNDIGIFGVSGGRASAQLLRDPADVGPPLSGNRVYMSFDEEFFDFEEQTFKRTGPLLTAHLDSMEVVSPIEQTFPLTSVLEFLPSDPDLLFGHNKTTNQLFTYRVSDGTLTTLETLDLSDGSEGSGIGATDLIGIAFTGAATNTAFAMGLDSIFGFTFNRLFSLDISTGIGTSIETIRQQSSFSAVNISGDIVIDSTGTMYSVGASFLIRIDKENGLFQAVGTGLGITGVPTRHGLAINPVDDSLYLVTRSDQSPDTYALYYIEKETGAAAYRGPVAVNAKGLDISTFTISEDPTPPPAVIFATDASATEGDTGVTPMDFTFHIHPPLAAPETVDITLAEGTAQAGIDYIDNSQEGFTIPAGVSTVTFTVDIIGDYVPELDETFTLTLSNPSGALQLLGVESPNPGKNTVTGTIIDNDMVTVASFDFNTDTIGQPPVGWEQVDAADFTSPPHYPALVGIAGPDTSSSVSSFEGLVTTSSFEGSDGTPFAFISLARINEGRGDFNRMLIEQVLISPAVDTSELTVTALLQFDVISRSGGRIDVLARDKNNAGPWVTLSSLDGFDFRDWDTVLINLPEEVISTETEFAFVSKPGGALAYNHIFGLDNVKILGAGLPDGFISVEVTNLTIPEGAAGETSDGPELILSDPATTPIEIAFTLTGGTAVNGLDYNGPTSGIITIEVGESSAVLPFEIVGNNIAEFDKTIEFTLNVVSGHALLANNQFDYVAIIENDDIPAIGQIIAFDNPSRTFHQIDVIDGSISPFLTTDDRFTGMDFAGP